MKYLLGMLCLNRPRTFDCSLTLLLESLQYVRNQVHIVVVDNGSNEETQEMLKENEKHIDLLIRNEWNTGYCFGVNRWMSLREPGQTCIQVDQDLMMHSNNWLDMVTNVLQDPEIGFIAARRPTAWIDRPDKVEGYKYIKAEKHQGYWLEVPIHGALIAPILIYKGEMLDKMGFENEATGWGDLESYHRVRALGYKSVYIPDIFIYQWNEEIEPTNHPQRGSHMALLQKRSELNRKYISKYLTGQEIYCGTRFKPETITSIEYKNASDENWEFNKEWPNVRA